MNGAASSEHWKAELNGVDENLKLAVDWLLGSIGAWVIVVSGSSVSGGSSTIHSYTAGGSSSSR